MTGIPSLRDMVQRELARRAEGDKPITIPHIFVEPIYDRNDRRIGSRVWDENRIELEEHDPRFRRGVLGYGQKGIELEPDDPIFQELRFRGALPPPPAPKGDEAESVRVAEDLLARAAARIAALRAR